jgi:hypothetical protein
MSLAVGRISSRTSLLIVTLAKAGVHKRLISLDSRLRGNDGVDGLCSQASKCHKVVVIKTPHRGGRPWNRLA